MPWNPCGAGKGPEMDNTYSHNTYIKQIIKWTFIGLAIRFVIMLFTLKGQDLFFINYFPMKLATEGALDPYGYIRANFPAFPDTYYGPVLYIIMAAPNFLFINIFHADSLAKILTISGAMMPLNAVTKDYIFAFKDLDLFKNLFLLKSPYLIFDFLIGWMIFKLSSSGEDACRRYKMWMLNIVVLHSAYAIGQFDLIPTFFIMLALAAAIAKRPYLCVISLCLGGGTKVFPFILVLPAILLLGDGWRKRGLLFSTAFASTLMIYTPFYVSSGTAFFQIFSQGRYYTGLADILLRGIFAVVYLFVSAKAIKDSKKPAAERQIIYYFLSLCFLVYAVTPISFRYFVFATPLIILFIPQHKKFGIFMLFIILLLAFLRLPTRDVQLGLLAPLNQGYFMSIPSAQDVIAKFINIDIVYKIFSKILLLSFFAAFWWVWSIKSGGNKAINPIKGNI